MRFPGKLSFEWLCWVRLEIWDNWHFGIPGTICLIGVEKQTSYDINVFAEHKRIFYSRLKKKSLLYFYNKIFFQFTTSDFLGFVVTLMLVLTFSFQYKTSKEGSTVGITVSHASMLAHCHALTQACGYSEGELDRYNFRAILRALNMQFMLQNHVYSLKRTLDEQW